MNVRIMWEISILDDLEAREFAEGLQPYSTTAMREVCALSKSGRPFPTSGQLTRSKGEMEEVPGRSSAGQLVRVLRRGP